MKKGQIIRPAENYLCGACRASFPLKPYQARWRLAQSKTGDIYCSSECSSEGLRRFYREKKCRPFGATAPNRQKDSMDNWSYMTAMRKAREKRNGKLGT